MTKVTQLSLDEDGGLGRRRIHLREISGDSEAPLETVGQDLRAARLRRGDDLATVSRSLKIRKDHLEAVEEDNLESLPGKTYAIGFVRSYATYLGLDTTATVERFKQEIAGRHEDHAASAPMMQDDDGRRLPQGWRIVAGIVILALIYGAWHLLFAGSTPQPVPPPPVLTPPHVAAAPAPVPEQAAPAAAANAPANANATPPAAAAPDAQAARQQLASQATAGTAAATASPAQTGSNPVAVPAAAPNGQVFGAQNKDARVVLRVRDDTRLTVRSPDGNVYINRDLKAGMAYYVPNLPGLYMATSNAGAIEVDLDGVALGRVGASQEILGRVSLDPQSLVDRYNTR